MKPIASVAVGLFLTLASVASISQATAATPNILKGLPSPVSDITTTMLNNSSIHLAWLSTGTAVTGSTIKITSTTPSASRKNESVTLGTDATFYTVTGLTPGATYSFRIASFNSSGKVVEVISAPTKLVTLPTAPHGLEATPGDGHVVLTWLTPEDTGATRIKSYQIQVRTLGTSDFSPLSTIKSTSDYNAKVVTSLINGNTYQFRIFATNVVGQSVASKIVDATPATVPDAPEAFIATPGVGKVILSWVAPTRITGTKLSSYTIRYRTATTRTYTALPNVSANSLTTTVTGLEIATSYRFVITANNSAGESESAIANASPYAQRPPVIELPPAVPTVPFPISSYNVPLISGGLGLWISAPLSDGGSAIIGYTVEYKRTQATEWTLLSSVSLNLIYNLTGLAFGEEIQFRVTAINAVGSSAPTLTNPATYVNLGW